jgi:hypothetical protein
VHRHAAGGWPRLDTLERLQGYVGLDPGHYVCRMETSPKKFWPRNGNAKRRQIRPLNHGKMVTKDGKKGEKVKKLAAILIHPGTIPSDFVGCIGVGHLRVNKLAKSGEVMEEIFKLCGGFEEKKKVHLEVIGHKPPTP